ncbi:hypothetical protein ACF0H5_013384 [Mactra antiquata]
MASMYMYVVHTTSLLLLLSTGYITSENNIPKIRGVRFLLTVNDTWADPPGCIKTVATDMIAPDVPVNKSQNITVGSCDHGPLNYTVLSPGLNHNKYTVRLTFYSSVIEDAEPPTCDLSWNGTYLIPKNNTCTGPVDLLPSCYTTDSREGWYLTYYWFHLLEWEFEDDISA